MAFTWLHVSDVHLSNSNPYNRDVVIPALFTSIKRFRNTTDWKPDVIFATGDIAEKGSVAAFKGSCNKKALATSFFDGLLDAAGLSPKDLFIVPGNHDVEQKMGVGLVRTLIDQQEADKFFDPDPPMYHLTGKLAAFSSWYNDYFCNVPRTFPDNSTCQLISYKVRDVRLGLLLLNSTLFCEDSKSDSGMLWIGRRSLSPLIEQLKTDDYDLVVALVHHPIEWLNIQYERTYIMKYLKSKVDILMHGHHHQTEVEFRDELIQIAAGATFLPDNKSPKRALYGTFDGFSVTVLPICYQEDSTPKSWTEDPAVFVNNKDHTKSFLIQRHHNDTDKQTKIAHIENIPLIGADESISFDHRSVQHYTLNDLDSGLVNKFLINKHSLQLLRDQGFEQKSFSDQLYVLGCTYDCGNGTVYPNVGAFLCFAPRHILLNKFESCSMDLVRYRGTNKLLLNPVRRVITDNLLTLYQEALDWLKSDPLPCPDDIDGLQMWIPNAALHEALANALMHRDYSIRQGSRIEVYDDRVEITSYGKWWGPKLERHLNISKDISPLHPNSVITRIFYHMGIAERNASGILRMIDEMISGREEMIP